jgi:hypothetical protein
MSVSLNLHRRHLSLVELSLCAGKAEELWKKYKAEAAERRKRKPADSVMGSGAEQKKPALLAMLLARFLAYLAVPQTGEGTEQQEDETMPQTPTLPKRYRTRREWIDLAEAVDADVLPPGPAVNDLMTDSRRIIAACNRYARWGASIVEFWSAVNRYLERHPPPEGHLEGLGPGFDVF